MGKDAHCIPVCKTKSLGKIKCSKENCLKYLYCHPYDEILFRYKKKEVSDWETVYP